ncbi:hypothetical protein Ae406Ps2_2375c [Pseudonocardia sp. Ae406_Ps2]|nr:hypothetical protein Ae331Ps2_3546 [Pseudonocardia sp. Ae331_Ps2]OLM02375.1 hypothetical protein Ae406Ps2_2375c [Pseudonocardia sp. Ae406_Ps2]OLM23947.1 hypothetical protein Ae706Ps2_2380c [Pseudonocardia sp. Ae706_Ps2]
MMISTYSVLTEILVDEFQLCAEDLSADARCGEVGLDSLTAAELAGLLRSRLGVEVQDYERLELPTLGDVAALVETRLPADQRQG